MELLVRCSCCAAQVPMVAVLLALAHCSRTAREQWLTLCSHCAHAVLVRSMPVLTLCSCCAVPAQVPMVEAMVALVLADQLLSHYAQCELLPRDTAAGPDTAARRQFDREHVRQA
jgi:hypothetical protein